MEEKKDEIKKEYEIKLKPVIVINGRKKDEYDLQNLVTDMKNGELVILIETKKTDEQKKEELSHCKDLTLYED